MTWMGYREYAAHRKAKGLKGTTLAAVQKALASGRIQANADKRIDAEAADVAWAAATNQNLQRGESLAAAPAPPVVLPILDGEHMQATVQRWRPMEGELPFPTLAPRSTMPGINVVDGDTFADWRTRAMRATALKAERELAVEEKNLVDASEARATYRSIAKMFAQSREAVPTQLGPQLVGLIDPREIEKLIRAAFRAEDLRIANEIATRYADVSDAAVSVGAGR